MSGESTQATTTQEPGQTQQTQQQTEPQPTSHWLDSVPEEMRDNKNLLAIAKDGDYKNVTPEMVLKNYFVTKEYVGELGKNVKVPGDDASEEEIAIFREKIGVPKDPKEYGIEKPSLPEGVPYDETLDTDFAENAHKAGLTKKQVEMVRNWYLERYSNAMIDQMADQQKSLADAKATLAKEWGTGKAFESNIALAQRTLKKFADPEDIAYMDKQGLSNDPVLVRLFQKIGNAGRQLPEFGGSTTTLEEMGPQGVALEIQKLVKDKTHALSNALFDKNDSKHKEALKLKSDLYTALAAFEEEEK